MSGTKGNWTAIVFGGGFEWRSHLERHGGVKRIEDTFLVGDGINPAPARERHPVLAGTLDINLLAVPCCPVRRLVKPHSAALEVSDVRRHKLKLINLHRKKQCRRLRNTALAYLMHGISL